MKLYSIQFLRALAALLVVYCHSIDLQVKHAVSYQQNFFHLQDFGAIGVDIFFVISGFIISFIGHDINGRQQTYQFLKKRFVRINPYYYLVSAVAFLLFLYQNNGAFTFKSVLKTITLLPVEPGSEIWWPILAIGWTLSFEWFFYLLFSVLIYNSIKSKEAYLIIMLLSLVALGVTLNSSLIIIQFITHPIILEFGAGALIGWLFRNKKIPSTLAFTSLMISVVCFLMLVQFGYGKVSESDQVLSGQVTFLRLFYFGIPSILLVFGCVFLEAQSKLNVIWENQTFQLLGNASYSIYLVHTIVFSLLGMLYERLGMIGSPDVLILIQLVLATIFGVICHLSIEKKILPASIKFLDSVELMFHKNYSIFKAR